MKIRLELWMPHAGTLYIDPDTMRLIEKHLQIPAARIFPTKITNSYAKTRRARMVPVRR